MIRLDQLGQIPNWITIVVVAVLTVCLFVGVPLARRAGRKAAGLAKTDNASTNTATNTAINSSINTAVNAAVGAAATDRGKDRGNDRIALFAALAPSVLVWLAVMGVSFIGLTGFAADFMQWRHWTNMLVPLSLDGISVSFGGWAFVAVKRGRHPGRAYRIVLAAATLSATLNFVHGRQVWSVWAGIYLAFLSLAGMAMFHEMLDQFMVNYDEEIARNAPYPRFGQRWFWAPISTLKARRAWIVYPPREGTRPTINNALDHWRAVRRMSRAQRIDGEPAWPAEGLSGLPTTMRADIPSHELAASPLASRFAPGEPVNGSHSGDNGASGASGAGAQANVAGAGQVSAAGSGDHRREIPAPQAKPATVNRDRDTSRAGGRPASNAEVNAAAEQLWIDHMKQGTELTGAQLLELFAQQYPHSGRRIRWAAHRRKAARARFAATDAATRAGEPDDLNGVDGDAPQHLDHTQHSPTQPQPTG